MDIPRSLLHQNRIDYADTALAILIAGTQKMSLHVTGSGIGHF
jgi:hypothetical protein